MRKPRPKPDFHPEPYQCLLTAGISVCNVSSTCEVRTVAALNEISWNERISRSQLIEEILVAYCRDAFPSRTIPTREEAKLGPEDDEETPSYPARLADGVRPLEHDEMGWRRGERIRS